jgi:acyl dehydratase
MHIFTQPPAIFISILRALFFPRRGLHSSESLPRLSAKLDKLIIDPAHLARYGDICQITTAETLPVLYPHVLAAPLHMWLITHPDFPLRLLGAVHLRNHIIQQRLIHTHEILSITCTIIDERRTEKGLEFDFTTVVKNRDEIVWEGLTTYFVRGKFGNADEESPLAELEKITDAELISEWHIGESIAKRYAVITQDYNPIHISKWLAKLLGFQRDLAHGFCVLAKSLSEAKIYPSSDKNIAHRIDVLFKGPVYLGNMAQLKQEDDRLDLYCGNNDRPSLCIKTTDIPANRFLTH